MYAPAAGIALLLLVTVVAAQPNPELARLQAKLTNKQLGFSVGNNFVMGLIRSVNAGTAAIYTNTPPIPVIIAEVDYTVGAAAYKMQVFISRDANYPGNYYISGGTRDIGAPPAGFLAQQKIAASYALSTLANQM